MSVDADGTVRHEVVVGLAQEAAFWIFLVATDIDWSTDEGPEITGTAEAILMSVAGRPQALDELAGPGLGTLRSRVVITRAA